MFSAVIKVSGFRQLMLHNSIARGILGNKLVWRENSVFAKKITRLLDEFCTVTVTELPKSLVLVIVRRR